MGAVGEGPAGPAGTRPWLFGPDQEAYFSTLAISLFLPGIRGHWGDTATVPAGAEPLGPKGRAGA